MSATRLSGSAGGPGEFAVPSASLGTDRHVFYQTADTAWCSCESFARHQGCKHTRAVRDLIHAEGRIQPSMQARDDAAQRLKAIEEMFS